MAPEDIVKRTLNATTQYYLQPEMNNRMDPRRHLTSRFPGLRGNRLNETFATDTFFPSVTSDRGNTCAQLFVGVDSERWEVFPMQRVSQNGITVQDFTRKI